MKRFLSSARLIKIVFGLALAFCLAITATVVLRVNAQGEGAQEAPFPGVSAGPYAQPIAFSHQHHVTEMEIDCQFCHAYARRGPVAGIPSVQRCVGCHRQVLNDSPEVQKLMQYWEARSPIEWVRVHDLPDHVRFTHKRHVRAGVECQDCHGDVGSMEAAQQVEELSMGWCLGCHQERRAPLDCLVCHY